MTNLDHHKFDAQLRMYYAMSLLDTLTNGNIRPGLLAPARTSAMNGQHESSPMQKLLRF